MIKSYNRLTRWISVTHRQFQMYMNRQLKAHALNASEFMYLQVLYGESEGMSQEQLAQELHLDNAAVTRSVRNLEEKGFVYRERDKSNHRMKRVFLSNKGEEFLPTLRRILDEWDDIMKESMDQEQYDLITNGLKDVSLRLLSK